MTITHRLYRASLLGSGTMADRYRSALGRYIVENADLPFEERSSFSTWTPAPIEATKGLYSLATAREEEHALCEDDPDITPMSPQFGTIVELQTWLDQQEVLGSSVESLVEEDGIPIDDLIRGTHRQRWRRIARRHHVGTFMARQRDRDALDFFKAKKGGRINEVPARARNRIRKWMEALGLDISWIKGNSTVRDVNRYILLNVQLPVQFRARFRHMHIDTEL